MSLKKSKNILMLFKHYKGASLTVGVRTVVCEQNTSFVSIPWSAFKVFLTAIYKISDQGGENNIYNKTLNQFLYHQDVKP